MSARKQRVYVRGSYLPFEEDETHEFKGHREIAPEDTPPWAFRHPHEHQTRQAISRNLNAFLNTGSGGVVYCGVDDRGRVLGLHLTRYQKDHVLVSVRSLLMRYRPAVPASRHRVTFVPVVSEADVEETPPVEFAYDARRRMKQHLVATSNYCWCDADARARSVSGIIPQSYVVEIAILPWADRDKALHPFYLTESGKCYVRRQASIVPLTAADCIRITRHEAAALSRRQSEQVALASQRDVAAALARLKSGQLWSPVGETACRCAVRSDSARTPVNTSVPGTQRPGREGERGQRTAERGEDVPAAATAVADVETPDATPAPASSSDGESIDKRSSGELSQIPSNSSTDGEIPRLSSTDALASDTPTVPSHSTRKLAHSSSSDSGVSLNSSDTGSLRKTCPFSSKRASSSSDCESTSLSDVIVTSSTTNDDTVRAGSAAHETGNFASGVQAVSELLQEMLASAIPPARQSPADKASRVGMGAEIGPDAAPSEKAASEAVTDASESEVFRQMEDREASGLDLDPGESGSDLARASQIDTDRALVDLSTSGTELAVSGVELHDRRGDGIGAGQATPDNSTADLGVSEANPRVSESDLGMSESDLVVSEADLGDSDAYLGTIQTERDSYSHSKQASMVTAEISLVESDLGVSDGDSSSKETLPGQIRSSPIVDDSDLPLCGTTAAEDSGPDPAFSESDASLLMPEPVSQTPVAHPGPARIRGRGKVFAHPEKVQEAGRELQKLEVDVSHGSGKVPDILEKVLEFSGRLVDAQLDKGRYELDSDDSDDSWDACFHPARRLTQSDCGTVG